MWFPFVKDLQKVVCDLDSSLDTGHIVEMERVGTGKKAPQNRGSHESELVESFRVSPHLTCLADHLNIPFMSSLLMGSGEGWP